MGGLCVDTLMLLVCPLRVVLCFQFLQHAYGILAFGQGT